MYNLLVTLLLLIPTAKPGKATAPTSPSNNVTCEGRFNAKLAKMKDPANIRAVTAISVMVNDQGAYAERWGGSRTKGTATPFVLSGGLATASSIAGKSMVAPAASRRSKPMEFLLYRKDGAMRLKWMFAGQKHDSRVDSCLGDYWTAATSESAVAIHLGPVLPVPEIE